MNSLMKFFNNINLDIFKFNIINTANCKYHYFDEDELYKKAYVVHYYSDCTIYILENGKHVKCNRRGCKVIY